MEITMRLKEKYRELSRLKDEINTRLAKGNSLSDIADLTLFLTHDQYFVRYYRSDTQLLLLLRFLKIWQEEKQTLPALGIPETIFYQVDSLDALVQKHRQIEYYGLRIENDVPESCCQELLDSLLEQKVSGLALGTVLNEATERVRDNILAVSQELKHRLNLPNAILLLQFALQQFPHDEELLLESADCWLQGQQFEKAYELLLAIENPAPEIQEMIEELQQVIAHDE